jgi:hypothetical protein
MLNKEMRGTGGGVPAGLTVEDKLINVTLKKAAEWVELELNQAPVSNPSTGSGAAVLK